MEKEVDVDAKDKRGWTPLRHVIATDFMGWSLDTNPSMKPSHIQICETMRVLVEFSANPYLNITPIWDYGYYPTAANLGVRHMDPKVRQTFSKFVIDTAVPNSSAGKDPLDMMTFTSYGLRWINSACLFLFWKY